LLASPWGDTRQCPLPQLQPDAPNLPIDISHEFGRFKARIFFRAP
jgi:hypothetical protein